MDHDPVRPDRRQQLWQTRAPWCVRLVQHSITGDVRRHQGIGQVFVTEHARSVPAQVERADAAWPHGQRRGELGMHADRQGSRRESWPAVRVLRRQVRQQHRNPGGVACRHGPSPSSICSPVTVRACRPAPASTLADSAPDISTRAHPDRPISSTTNRQSRCTSSPAPAAVSCSVTAAMMRARRPSSRTSPPRLPRRQPRGIFPHRSPLNSTRRTVQRPRIGATAAMMEPPAGHTRALLFTCMPTADTPI